MLHMLDQWAFSALLFLNSILGVADLPVHSNLDWTIEQNWVELPDRTYEIVLKSTDIIPQCLARPNGYIIFPQVYMGYHEVWIDSQRVYENAIGEKKYLNSFFSKPILACNRITEGAKAVTFKVNSYIKYFATLPEYPTLTDHFPKVYFLYNGLYIGSMAICICLGIMGAVLIKSESSKPKIINFFLQDFLFSAAIFCYSVGEFGRLDIQITHVLMIFGLWGGFYIFVYPFYLEEKNYTKALLVLGILLPVLFTLIGYKNLTQLVLIFPIPIVLMLVLLLTINIFADKTKIYKLPEKAILIAILVFGFLDAYITIKSRLGVFHLSFLFISLSCFKFFKVIRLSQERNFNLQSLSQRLSAEKNIVGEISRSHEMHREIIHDIKSPITSLSMLLSVDEINKSLVIKVKDQISDILSRIDDDGIRRSPDWYSVYTLKNVIEDLVETKKPTTDLKIDFKLDVPSDKISDVFFDPLFVKIIFSELIDNSAKQIKNGATEISANFVFGVKTNTLSILIVDNGPGLSDKERQVVGEKMASSFGGGVGLHSLRRRMVEFGGDLQFKKDATPGFGCVIDFPIRNVK